MDLDFLELGARLGTIFVPFLFALCFHEFAHGLVAKWRGDNTAEMSGRLTLNPMAHADPLGTFILPILLIVGGSGFFFGWANPVPVNARNMRNARWDMFWVALAGPMSNVILALAATFALYMLSHQGTSFSFAPGLAKLLVYFIHINLFLAFFNLIPIHPLDGGKVIEPFLPYTWNRWLEQNQGMLNLGLMMFILLAGSVLAFPVVLLAEFLINLAR